MTDAIDWNELPEAGELARELAASRRPHDADGHGATGGGADGGGETHHGISFQVLDEFYTCDQAGMAELFVDRYGANLGWNAEVQRFVVFSARRGHWWEDGKGHEEVWRRVRDLSKEVKLAVDGAIAELGLEELANDETAAREDRTDARRRMTAIRSWYGVFKNAGMPGVIRAASPSCRQYSTRDFNRPAHLLNLANGTYDVRTGELRAHEQADMLTHRVEVTYRPELAERPLSEVAPEFAQLVRRACAAPGEVSEEVHAERVAAVCRWLGYLLHGANPEKKMAVFEGATDIGKNQILEVVGEIIGPDLAWLGGRPALLVKTRGDRHDAEESRLAGKRLVVVNELTQEQHLDEGQVLRFVNPEGSTVSLRRMKQDLADALVTWKLNVSTNELPKARLTPQVTNRLALYPMSQVPVPKSQQYDVKRLILQGAASGTVGSGEGGAARPPEAEAVLAHLVRWWRDWWVARTVERAPTGLVITEEMRSALDVYQEENKDLYDLFIEECLDLDPEAPPLPSFKPVWELYQDWHRAQHPDQDIKYVPGRNKFCQRLESLGGVEVVRDAYRGKNRVRSVRGIRLVGEDQLDLSALAARARTAR